MIFILIYFGWGSRGAAGVKSGRVLSLDATCLDPSPHGRVLVPVSSPQQLLSGQEEPWSPFSVLSEGETKPMSCYSDHKSVCLPVFFTYLPLN